MTETEKERQNSFVPIHNPFVDPDVENFPSLSNFLDTSITSHQEEDSSMNVSEAHHTTYDDVHAATHISLNLSIDTLAKVNPVDISNMEEFLEQKEKEDHIEESQKEYFATQDAEYFLNRPEDLSPQSKAGTRTVLYDSFMEKQDLEKAVQTTVSIDPNRTVDFQYSEGQIDVMSQMFDNSVSMRDEVCTPKAFKNVKSSPMIEDPSFLSPIAVRTETPLNKKILTPNFISPFTSSTKIHYGGVIFSPGLTPIKKSNDEENFEMKDNKVAKQLEFQDHNLVVGADEMEDDLPITNAIKSGMVTTSRGQYGQIKEFHSRYWYSEFEF
jgi:hypothetical protein